MADNDYDTFDPFACRLAKEAACERHSYLACPYDNDIEFPSYAVCSKCGKSESFKRAMYYNARLEARATTEADTELMRQVAEDMKDLNKLKTSRPK